MTILSLLARDPRRITILLIFAAHGITVGTFFSRIAELQAAIGLSEAQLGVALLGMPTGAFTGAQVVSRLIERYGTRLTLMVALPWFGLVLVITSLAFDTASLFGCLVLFGLALLSCNITMNVEADRVEAATGRRLINRCHGTWGIGFLAATIAGTGAVAAGIPPTVHFLAVFAVIVVMAVLVVGPMQPSPPRAHSGAARPRRFAVPTVGVLLIIGFACSGIWLEGATRNWSIIYLRNEFTVADWITTLTLPSIVVTQIIGRFLADGLIDRFGPVRVAVVLSAISFLGLFVVVIAGSVPLVLLGFALIGFGISTTHPQALSAAARLGDRPSSQNVAALSTVQMVISFVSPPLFGLVASEFGINASFAMLLPLPLISIYFARYLARSTA